MSSARTTIPPESSREAEQQRETSRAELRARAHSPGTSASSASVGSGAVGAHSSPSSHGSADDGADNRGGGLGHDEDRYELSFVIRPPTTVSVASDVSPPIIVRIRRFRGDGELLAPALMSSPPISESRSHSSLQSSDEGTHISSSEHSTGLDEGILLLLQLALYGTEEYTAITPSPLQGITVRSPEVYLDPDRLADVDQNNGEVIPPEHRYFGIFSNFRIAEAGRYRLFVVLLQGVGLAPLMHGQVAPAGRQLARITVPILAAESSGQGSEVENETLSDGERRILQHFQDQGADVSI
ncbi:hypothetical protein POJ06DRAFT_45593 [Lipomyces tetrasporus]|uniref:Velvet domain-containing protein n=1 Tax=Lipomyces tetrasporus TaxID=54092 RepID=A0AAD7VPA5_9ASCO|nr:uncharacterized protein POJ06DRAFT_45593 [Lipomyces tetrasporus]KAJ8096878.1 hypothetical protein POJ06DRAFT_45593 [Lipomyces tetrasporus]